MNPLDPGHGRRTGDEPEHFEHSPDARLIFRLGRHEWQAPYRFEQAHIRHRGLHGDGIRLHEINFHKRMIAAVNRARGRKVALEGEPRQLRHFRWDFVGDDGDDAAPTQRDERERDGVVAGEDDEVIRHSIEYRCHLGDVTRGFLDANNIFDFGEALHGRRLDVHAGAALHAVQNNRQGRGLGDGAIVLEQPFLRRLVVIGCDREEPIYTESGKLAREGDDFRGVITACTPEDWHLTLSQFDGDLNDAKMFFVRERGALAGCSAGNEEVDACLDLPKDQTTKSRFVERTVGTKRGDKCGAGAGKHGVSPSESYLHYMRWTSNELSSHP